MKYYTLEDATKKAYREKRLFELEREPPVLRNYINLVRMFFCCEPKLYFFPKQSEKEFKHYMKKVEENRLKHHNIDWENDSEETNYKW